MNTSPTISIIVPTYNRAKTFLPEAIASALKQSFTDFELIIIDDASEDTTEQLVKSYSDSRIRYIRTAHNHGEYWATNYGANLSQGKYLTWLHSDDLLLTDSLLVRYQALTADNTLDFVHGDIEKINSEGAHVKNKQATDITQHLFEQYVASLNKGEMLFLVHHTTILMKRTFFYRAGPLDCSLPYAGDIDWLIRALRIGKCKRVAQVVYSYRSHSGNRRTQDVKQGIDIIAIHKQIARRYIAE